MAHVMVVDDDDTVASVVVNYLERAGHSTRQIGDGQAALDAVSEHEPDLMVLDLMLPGLDGLEVCRRVRLGWPHLPVVMLTALAEPEDRIAGLEVGADDYVTKPFRLRELIARVRAALRRVPAGSEPESPQGDVIEIGDVRVDVARHEVSVRGDLVALPLKEFELLELLLANAGRVLTRDVLIDRIWGPNYFGDTKTLDVHVKRLRTKVEEDPGSPTHIVTVRGVGYRFEKPRVAAS
jgi:two-component system response regulator RegX3